MKKTSILLLCACCYMLFTVTVSAQDSSKKAVTLKTVDEDDGPIMFKFEPDFVSKNEKRKTEIALTRSLIDSLDVSERKRLKLLRDLYKNGVSKRLQKALLAENTFEDIED